MRISRYIIVSLALVALSLPLPAQVNDTYVIPAAGNTPGANGTQWATQFSLFNPQAYPLTVSVTFLPSGGAQGTEKLMRAPSNATVFSDNILFDAFGASGSGALLVATFPEDNQGVTNTVLARSFLVTSDTYNNSGSGTYGQSIPGIWTGLQDFNTDGISGISHGIRNLPSQGWRTNIGAVNLGRYSATLRVTVYDGAGQPIASQLPFPIPPQGHVQDPLPVNVDRGSIEFFVDDPFKDAVVFAYASVIDQRSGDPRYESPVLLASPSVLFGQKKGPVIVSTLGSSAATVAGAVGKKIDIETARAVRANAIRGGSVELMRDASGGYRLMR